MEACGTQKISTESSKLVVSCRSLYASPEDGMHNNCASANAWWRTLKCHVLGVKSDIPPPCSPGRTFISDPR